MDTTLQIRIDKATKTKAIKMFKNMGLDLSSGIKFLLARESDPNNLTYVCPFGFTHKYNPKIIEKYEREAVEALKHGKRYSSTREMFDDILV
ncbi:MAG: type II toxin-antitoxin system RelB/DinJ family antitoxin [Minisyncoccia bacterium]